MFGQDFPPLEPRYARERPCRWPEHLRDAWTERCTECGYFLDDLCWVDGCRNVGYGEVCADHAAFVQPEARA